MGFENECDDGGGGGASPPPPPPQRAADAASPSEERSPPRLGGSSEPRPAAQDPEPAKNPDRPENASGSSGARSEGDGIPRRRPPPQRRTLFEEAEDCLGMSILMFLYADLRLLSATGRINTRFETLRVESDYSARTTADEIGAPRKLAGGVRRAVGDDAGNDEGISPAQIMAVLIVELRREVLLQRKRAKERVRKEREAQWVGGTGGGGTQVDGDDDEDDDEEDDAVLATITHKGGRRQLEEDGMNEMMKAYNDMIGKDLKRELPVVKPNALGAWMPQAPKMKNVRERVETTRRNWKSRMSLTVSTVGGGAGASFMMGGSHHSHSAAASATTSAMDASNEAAAAKASSAVEGGGGDATAAASATKEDDNKEASIEVAIDASDSIEVLKGDENDGGGGAAAGGDLDNTATSGMTASSIGTGRAGARSDENRGSIMWERFAQKRHELDQAFQKKADDFESYMQESRERRALRRNMLDDTNEYGLAAETAATVTEMGEVGDVLFGMAGNVRRRDPGTPTASFVEGGEFGEEMVDGGGGDAAGFDASTDTYGGLAPIHEVSSVKETGSSCHSDAMRRSDLSSDMNDATDEKKDGSDDEDTDDEEDLAARGRGGSLRGSAPKRASSNSLVWDRSANSEDEDGEDGEGEDEDKYKSPSKRGLGRKSASAPALAASADKARAVAFDDSAGPFDGAGGYSGGRAGGDSSVGGGGSSSRSRQSRATSSVASSGRALSETELLDHMSRCIESRDYGKLDFMTGFFGEGTLSRLMIKSKARVVWLNDWYPIQDCIYAVSVDEEKRRVLVVFRGAITEADWSHSFDSKLKKVPNPVRDKYDKRTDHVKVYRGFYTYLFRQRKDTGTRKYDEIADLVHEYGMARIGGDYELVLNGFSLGGALATLFGMYASTDERFTRNGPVRIFTFGSPYVLSHSFAAAYNHQERMGRLQHARIYNTRDFVAHLPPNMHPLKGSRFRHVGVSVKLKGTLFGRRPPKIHYVPREGSFKSYWRAVRNNSFINMPLPWKIKTVHGLAEHLRRLSVAREMCEGSEDPLMHKSLDEIYELLVLKGDAEAAS